MHELAHLLVSDETVETTLQRISDLAARVIDDCDAAGVTLVDGRGGYVTAAHTAQRTPAVDRGPYHRGRGPGLPAVARRAVLPLEVGKADERLPAFVRDAPA